MDFILPFWFVSCEVRRLNWALIPLPLCKQVCCGLILSLVQILFSFVQTHYHTLQYPKTKENKIWTKDKIEPQKVC